MLPQTAARRRRPQQLPRAERPAAAGAPHGGVQRHLPPPRPPPPLPRLVPAAGGEGQRAAAAGLPGAVPLRAGGHAAAGRLLRHGAHGRARGPQRLHLLPVSGGGTGTGTGGRSGPRGRCLHLGFPGLLPVSSLTRLPSGRWPGPITRSPSPSRSRSPGSAAERPP